MKYKGGTEFPFILATVSLLAIPGPTNTLLATSGANLSFSRPASLLAAALGGYLLAVAVLRVGLASVTTDVPLVSISLRVTITLYLVYLARLLWRCDSREQHEPAPVTFRSALLTSLLNPKATVVAFVLLPSKVGLIELSPWIAATAVLIVVTGAAWIALGAIVGRRLRNLDRLDLVHRLSACVLIAMATALSVQTFYRFGSG